MLPRIPFEELPCSLAEALAPRVQRLGYFGEFFQCGAHQPDALLAFHRFTEASKEALPIDLVETIALTCAAWMGNEYERNQHERLALKLGFSADWIASVLTLQPESGALTEQHAAVQRLVLTVLESRGHGASSDFDNIVDTMGPKPAVAILMVIGRYVVHGLFVNTLQLAPPVASIFSGSSATR